MPDEAASSKTPGHAADEVVVIRRRVTKHYSELPGFIDELKREIIAPHTKLGLLADDVQFKYDADEDGENIGEAIIIMRRRNGIDSSGNNRQNDMLPLKDHVSATVVEMAKRLVEKAKTPEQQSQARENAAALLESIDVDGECLEVPEFKTVRLDPPKPPSPPNKQLEWLNVASGFVKFVGRSKQPLDGQVVEKLQIEVDSLDDSDPPARAGQIPDFTIQKELFEKLGQAAFAAKRNLEDPLNDS